uniref:Uncharacterized protein ycf68 n=1 Tax=Peganum multisectum TaxID=673035 RepID=A0A8E5JVM3_9ROSI|nr:hypothetical protein RF68 [Peganum multisectum]QVD40755.1 hypothetical protein RF68 [Peganum multisectum]
MAYFSCSNRGFETKLLLRRIDGAIQVRSNVDPTFYSLVGSGRSGGDHHGSSLLDNPYIPYQCMDSYLSSTGLGSASMGKKMEHLTTYLHRPRTTRSPLSFHSGVTEGSYHSSLFFHAFPGGLEKAAINRKKNLPSRKEEREILFPFPFRRDQEIGSSRKKNAWLINNSLLGLRPPQSLRTPPIGAMGCVYLSIS